MSDRPTLIGVESFLDEAVKNLTLDELHDSRVRINAARKPPEFPQEGQQVRQAQQQDREEGRRLYEERVKRMAVDPEYRQSKLFSILKDLVWGTMTHCYTEVHEILCTEGKLSAALNFGGMDAKAVGAALAASLAASFGFTNPVAVGFAAVVLCIVGTAGSKAFCSLDKDEVLAALRGVDLPHPKH